MNAADHELVLERRGAVLVMRLNRPAASNALTQSLLCGIGAAASSAEADPDVRVVVITGTGERAFCAGMDLRSFSDGEPGDDANDAMDGYNRLIHGGVTIPVIGAANGTAVGGGLELLMGCDVVVASSTAQFGFPEVKRGLFPAGGGTFIGTRVPLGIALEMTLTGDRIDAARAYELGLVNAVVEPSEVLTAALAFAERIALNAPLALAAVKELVRLGVSDAERWSTRRGVWQSIVFASEDAKEGAAAFFEKRAPVWRGR